MTNDSKTFVLVSIVLILLGVLLYFPVGKHGYSIFDDLLYIVYNSRVQEGLTRENIIWAFTEYQYQSNWHPLTWLSYMADISLFGFRPGPQHWVNVILHLINSLLVYKLTLTMLKHWQASVLVAILFLIHPLHVESVAWISERKDLLCGVFFLWGMLAYFRYAKAPSIQSYLGVAVLFVLALLSKPMAVTFPIILLLMDYWPLQRHEVIGEKLNFIRAGRFSVALRLFVEKLPLFLLSLASGVITLLSQSSSLNSLDTIRFTFRMINAVTAYMNYVWGTLLPLKLAFYYPIKPVNLYTELLPAAACFVAISYIALKYSKKYPEIPVGWLWFVITLLPVIGLIQVGSQARADRYMYLPSIGLFLVFGGLIARLNMAKLKKATAVISPFLVLYFFLAVIQVGYWGKPLALFMQALENGGESYHTRLNLASVYLDSEQPESAMEHIHKAIELASNNPLGYTYLGRAYFQKGQYMEARKAMEKAAHIDPLSAVVWNNLGTVVWAEGNLSEALEYYEKSLALNPNFSAAKQNIGGVKFAMERASNN